MHTLNSLKSTSKFFKLQSVNSLSIITFVLLLGLAPLLSFSQPATLCHTYGQEPFAADITIGGPGFPSPTTTSSLGVTGWTGKKIIIYGTLKINTVFTISNCIIRMQPGARIEIESNANTSFSFNKIFTCGLIWNGIQVNPASKGMIYFSYNRIEDAYYALTIQSPDAKINLYANNFNRNAIGIAANGIAVNALLTANLFNKTSAFNWGNNQAPTDPIGISLNTATASLGNSNSTGINIRNRYYNQLK